MCWLIWKTSWTLNPILKLDDLIILTKKHPSPSINPTSQLESGISWSLITGLKTGIKLRKYYFNWSEIPLFIEALIATILLNPSRVRCFLHLINSKACLNKR